MNKKGQRNLHFQVRLFDGNEREKEAIDAYGQIASWEFDMPDGKRRKMTAREIGTEALLALYEKLSGGYTPVTQQAANNEADVARLIKAVETLLAGGQGISFQQHEDLSEQIQRINITRNSAGLAGGLTAFEADNEEW